MSSTIGDIETLNYVAIVKTNDSLGFVTKNIQCDKVSSILDNASENSIVVYKEWSIPPIVEEGNESEQEPNHDGLQL